MGSVEQSISRTAIIDKWSVGTGRMKGNTPQAKAINNYLDTLANKVHTIERGKLKEVLNN